MSVFYDRRSAKNAFERAVTIALLSVLLSALFISVVNDIYAFVKPLGSVELTLAEPLPLRELASMLQNEGVIKNPTVFSLFVKFKGKTAALESFLGTVTLQKNMSYREIILSFS